MPRKLPIRKKPYYFKRMGRRFAASFLRAQKKSIAWSISYVPQYPFSPLFGGDSVPLKSTTSLLEDRVSLTPRGLGKCWTSATTTSPAAHFFSLGSTNRAAECCFFWCSHLGKIGNQQEAPSRTLKMAMRPTNLKAVAGEGRGISWSSIGQILGLGIGEGDRLCLMEILVPSYQQCFARPVVAC